MFSFIGIVNFENQYFSEVYLYHINQNDLSFKNSLDYRVENQGYDSTSILINCSDLFFSFILLIVYYIWIALISLVLRPPYDTTDKNIWKSIYNKLYKLVKDKRSNLFFNSIIRILLEVFLDLLFWWGLNLYDLTFKNFTDVYSSIVALFCACILVAFVLLVFSFALFDPKWLNTSRTEALRETMKISNGSRFYYLIFVLKRLLLVSLIILCKNSGLIQTWAFGVFLIFMLVLLLFIRPFSSSLSNIQEILFELITVSIVLIFLNYLNSSTEFVEEGVAVFFGWICIGLVLSTIVINYIFQIVSTF